MNEFFKERDWKYMRSIKKELLHALCSRINREVIDIVTAEGKNPHERYLGLYQHIQKSDRIVADCFNRWSRSWLHLKILCLRRHDLLKDAHVEHLSEGGQEWLAKVEDL